MIAEDSDHAFVLKCREEDEKYQDLELSRRSEKASRILADEKAQQVECIAGLSALLAIFTTSMLVEPAFEPDADSVIVAIFCASCMSGVGLLVLSMINSSYLLVGILKFDCSNKNILFEEFWRKRCASDLAFCYITFSLGLILCITSFALISWILLFAYRLNNVLTSSTSVLTLLVFARSFYKWGPYILK